MEIRSYRAVFDLERRIYRIDRLKLNPSGVPLRGVVYFLAVLAAVLLVSRVPLLRLALVVLPWYLRDLVLPGALATLAATVKLDGRPFHLAALALLRYRLAARELVGLRPVLASAPRHWSPGELVLLADGSDSRLRRLRCTGPATVTIGVAHIREVWSGGALGRLARRAEVKLAPLPGTPAPRCGQRIALVRGARLEVRL